MKERSPGKHLQRASLRPRPDERWVINSSAIGVISLIKAGHAKPEACWARGDEAGVIRLVLPREGKDCFVVVWGAGACD